MKTVQAVYDKIIVSLDVNIENKTESGIFIPETATTGQPQKSGTVKSIGEKVSYKDKLNIGDIIIFHPRAGMDILLGKEVMKVLNEGEVYGIVKEV
jgi:co-chaperonin GroES (HSP10)